MKLSFFSAAAALVTLFTATAIMAQVLGEQTVQVERPYLVILNEIMANPSGSDDGNEFVELWNVSGQWVDVGGWHISDNSTTDTIEDHTGYYDIGLEGTEIPPGGYAIIVEGDYSGEYNEYLEEYAGVNNFVMVKVDDDAIGSGLNDDGDTVTVTQLDPFGRIFSKSYTSNASLHPGQSLERDRYDSSAWHWSPDPEYGCTPGGINSYQ